VKSRCSGVIILIMTRWLCAGSPLIHAVHERPIFDEARGEGARAAWTMLPDWVRGRFTINRCRNKKRAQPLAACHACFKTHHCFLGVVYLV
jgi:hypothetical protein